MADRMAPESLPPLAIHERSQVGQGQVPADRFSEDHLLLGAHTGQGPTAEPGRSRSQAIGNVQETWHLARRAKIPGRCRYHRRRRGRRVRQRLGGDDLQANARRHRHYLLPDVRSRARAPRVGAQVPRLGCALHRQFLRDAELGRVHRRVVRVHTEGRALPDGVVHVLPHQRQVHRPVRAHVDHRRAGRVRQLPGRLHRAHAR